MKKFKRILAGLSCVVLILSFCNSAVALQSEEDLKLYDQLKASGELVKIDADIPCFTETVLSINSIDASKIDYLKNNQLMEINSDVEIESLTAVDDKYNPQLDREVNFLDGSSIGLNEYGKIVALTNSEKEIRRASAEKTREDVLQEIVSYYNLDERYKLTIEESTDTHTRYCWERVYANGAVNPYDSLKVSIAANNEIIALNHFSEQPEQIQSASVARTTVINEVCRDIDVSYSAKNDAVSLVYVKPNFFWNKDGVAYENCDVLRLAYVVENQDGAIVYIDAETGENLGGSIQKAMAGVFACGGLDYAYESAALAESGMRSLNYTVDTDVWTVALGSEIRLFMGLSSAYGLYIDSHGSASSIGDNSTWSINASEITGNWHFVFLDACSTAASTTWANAFKINGYSSRAFLGWSNNVTIGNAYKFCKVFWKEIEQRNHYNSVEAIAEWSANQIPGSGTTPIRFYGDQSYAGYAH